MSDPLERELRPLLGLEAAPPRVLDGLQVHQLLTRQPLGYLRYLRRELDAVAAGREPVLAPPRQTFADPGAGGDFRVMPCVVGRHPRARKTVVVLGARAARQASGAPAAAGRACLLDPEENTVACTLDAAVLGSARAGATAALAAELLAEAGEAALVVGAGRVGLYCALYLAARGAAQRLVVADLQPLRARRVVDYLARWYPEARLEAADARSAAGDWSLVVTATDSTEPVYQPKRNPAPLVVSLGADTAWRRELPLALAGSWPVYVDSPDALRVGDLRHWRSRGLVRGDELMDLVTLVREGRKPRGEDPAVFVSVGSPLLDNLTIGYVMQALEADEAAGG